MNYHIKTIVACGILFFMTVSKAAWVIVNIENDSNLTLVQAARNNGAEIPSISQLLVANIHNEWVAIPADALFGSVGGCKIIAHNKQNNQILFTFFGDPTHRVANGRAPQADLDSRNAAATLKSSYMARVFLVIGDTKKLVGFLGFDEENQPMNLKIMNSGDSYEVLLFPQAV